MIGTSGLSAKRAGNDKILDTDFRSRKTPCISAKMALSGRKDGEQFQESLFGRKAVYADSARSEMGGRNKEIRYQQSLIFLLPIHFLHEIETGQRLGEYKNDVPDRGLPGLMIF